MEDLRASLSAFMQEGCDFASMSGGESADDKLTRLLPPWDEVEQAVSLSPIEALTLIQQSLSTTPSQLVKLFFTTYSWEIMDLLYSLTTLASGEEKNSKERKNKSSKPEEGEEAVVTPCCDEDEVEQSLESCMDYMVSSLVDNVRLKEVEIMVMEKAHMSMDSYSLWHWLVFMIQCLVVKSLQQTSPTIATSGKTNTSSKASAAVAGVMSAIEQSFILLLSKAEQLIKSVKNKGSNEEDHDTDSSISTDVMMMQENKTNVLQEVQAMTEKVVSDLILFTFAVINRQLTRLPSSYLNTLSISSLSSSLIEREEQELGESIFSLCLSFLSHITGRFAVNTTTVSFRQDRLMPLLSHAYLSLVLAKEGHLSSIEKLFPLLKEKAFQCLQREKKSVVMMWREKESKKSDSNNKQVQVLLSRGKLSIEHALSNEEKVIRDAAWSTTMMVDRERGRGNGNGIREIVTPSLLTSPSTLSFSLSLSLSLSQQQTQQESKRESDRHLIHLLSFQDGHVMGWTLLVHSIAMKMLLMLQRERKDSLMMPLVYDRDFYLSCLHHVLPFLLAYTEVSSEEGLQTLITLYPSTGRVDDLKPYYSSEDNNKKQVFVSQWARLKQNQILDDFAKVYYGIEGCESQYEEACTIASQSLNLWNYCQWITTALAVCRDSSNTIKGYHSFKCFLVDYVSPKVLFPLLAQLIEHCPYKQMHGVLVDVVKAMVQLTTSTSTTTTTTYLSPSSSSPPSDGYVCQWNKVSPVLLPQESTNSSRREDVGRVIRDSDIIQIVNRITDNTELIESMAFLSSSTDCNSVFYSPYLVKRFALCPLSKVWKTMKEKLKISTEETNSIGSTVNLFSFVISRLLVDIKKSSAIECSYWQCNENKDITESVRDLFDLLVLLCSLKKLIQQNLLAKSQSSGEQRVAVSVVSLEETQIELLVMNMDGLIMKLEELLVYLYANMQKVV